MIQRLRFSIRGPRNGLRQSFGFTLIEVLVVSTIISMFGSLIMASVNQTRAKARDARRIADLHALQVAIETYATQYGHYPLFSSQTFSGQARYVRTFQSTFNWTGGDLDGMGDLKAELAPFLSPLPVDPLDNDALLPVTPPAWGLHGYGYFVSSDGSYDLVAVLEADNPDACGHMNWISHTGGWAYSNPTYPGVGNSWCSGAYPFSNPLYVADH